MFGTVCMSMSCPKTNYHCTCKDVEQIFNAGSKQTQVRPDTSQDKIRGDKEPLSRRKL